MTRFLCVHVWPMCQAQADVWGVCTHPHVQGLEEEEEEVCFPALSFSASFPSGRVCH